jgi:hypothetical protein
MHILREHLSFDTAEMKVISEDAPSGGGKNLFMEGICLQGGVLNENGRVYEVREISKAVESINDKIRKGFSVLGEVDHPEDLKINLDRVCANIKRMWMDGPNGFGKLQILPTPMGNLVRAMLESGVKLGVSSRGQGNVDRNGKVSDFEIVTVDIVAQPSAPNAYPTPVYEGVRNMRHGHHLMEMAKEAKSDQRVQKYLEKEVTKLIKELKLK